MVTAIHFFKNINAIRIQGGDGTFVNMTLLVYGKLHRERLNFSFEAQITFSNKCKVLCKHTFVGSCLTNLDFTIAFDRVCTQK